MLERTILIAGATSKSGGTCARTLLAAGATVIAVASNAARLAELTAAITAELPEQASHFHAEVCDLASLGEVEALASRVHSGVGAIDGLVQLVGGWRGGGGLAAQSDEDWDFLEIALNALRNTTRVFNNDLIASTAGRLAIVSSTSVDRPLAGGANYAAIKAASEAWTRAVAQGFRKADSDAAAVIFVVKALSGLEQRLADEVLALWAPGATASSLNESRIPLHAD